MFAHPYTSRCLSGLLGDTDVEQLFDSAAMLRRMLAFEAALNAALLSEQEILADAHDAVGARIDEFVPNLAELSRAAGRDGVVVPELVRQVRAGLPEEYRGEFHRGVTSQDLVDTALAMTLVDYHRIVGERLGRLRERLVQLIKGCGNLEITARTRMQAAGRMRVASRMTVWQRSVDRNIAELQPRRDQISVLQFAGPVGNRDALPFCDPDRIAMHLAQLLGLTDPGAGWQTDRGRLLAYSAWLGDISGSLGKLGQDFCLMAQAGEIEYSGGGVSSSLPGKNNPVKAEILVTLARFNAVLISGIHHSMVHEQERSGSAWTLEWMILPQMCLATAVSLTTAIDALGSITGFCKPGQG